ncbi:hypothetical protein N7523_002111 [Penicillium sp. IBT 18751x]|nr:hypothetical protein N7523_008350 [Penicillium sp. IBT 18751x]KAJ6126499.1 hypothetical protein N7523_002111 [Penicillium sp. IBT 18751x]
MQNQWIKVLSNLESQYPRPIRESGENLEKTCPGSKPQTERIDLPNES